MPIVRQADFTGGEIDPRLWGKTTHQKYPTFVRTLRNFIAIPQGAAMNRPGTVTIALAKDQTAPAKLIHFDWPSQNYLLEVSAGNIRVYANGVFVVDVAAAAITAGMVDYLKYSQKDADLILTYGGQGTEPNAMAPRQLRRNSHTVWTFGAASLVPPTIADLGTLAGGINGKVSLPDATHPTRDIDFAITATLRDTTTSEVFETTILRQVTTQTNGNPLAYAGGSTYAAGDQATSAGSIYTSLQNGNTGHALSDPAWWRLGVVAYPDALLQLTIGYTGWAPGAQYQIIGFNFYSGHGGVWGLINSADANATAIVTVSYDGTTPDYAHQPPAGTDPFAIYDTSGAIIGHDYPACVTHYQQRRVFAHQPSHLGRIQGSKPGQSNNFDVTDIVQDSDAFNFDLSSQAIEDIRSLISARALIVLTSTGGTVVRGSGSQRGGSTAVTPSSIDATKQGTRGASWVDPVMVDNTVLYVGSKAAAVRAASYDPFYEVLSNMGTDLALVAQHFLRNHSIIDMAYQESPNSIVWMVRDDGLLLGLTFVPAPQPDEAIHGWHQHPTNGTVQRVCVVQEGLDDVLYMVTQRAGAFYIERMASRTLPVLTVPAPTADDPTATTTVEDVRFGVFLDASATFDGRNTGVTTMAFVSDAATYDGGEEGTITASAAAFAGVSDEGDQIIFDPNGTTGGPFSLTVLSYTDSTHVRAILNAPLPAGFQIATTSWGWARDTVAGLGHLEARDVMALADGAVQGPFTVAGGAITLTQPAVIVTAGLSYTSDLELLDIMPDQVRTNVKAILKVTLEVVGSRGVLAGMDAKNTKPWVNRAPPDAFGNPPLVTDQIDIPVSATWNKNGRAFIRQVDPLPLIVTAASRELEIGGRGG